MLEIAKQAGLKKEHANDREYIGDFDWRLFGDLIVKECMTVCDEVHAVYLKHRKSSFDFEDKNIYAEGEAASDAIKHKIKRAFEVK
jgi:hypothetical protein